MLKKIVLLLVAFFMLVAYSLLPMIDLRSLLTLVMVVMMQVPWVPDPKKKI